MTSGSGCIGLVINRKRSRWSGPGSLEIMAVGLIMAWREKGPSSKGMGHLSMPAREKEGASPDWILVVGGWQDFSSG